MRRLARELGVTPMALYWHFADKDALLDAMAERVVTDFSISATFVADLATESWPVRYRQVLSHLVELLRAHPWMGRMVIERIVPQRNYLTAMELMLDAGREAGFDIAENVIVCQQAVQAVVALVEDEPRASSSRRPVAALPMAAATAKILGDFGADEFPHLAAAVVPLTRPVAAARYYRLGLDLIIGGIAAVAGERRSLQDRDADPRR